MQKAWFNRSEMEEEINDKRGIRYRRRDEILDQSAVWTQPMN